MVLKRFATHLFTTLALVCLALVQTSALAREMLSIKDKVVNRRSEPSTESPILWKLEQGDPLQVLKRRGECLRARITDIRSGPSTHFRVVGKSERYDLLRTGGSKAGWVKVQRVDSVKGWVYKKLLWHW